MLLFLVVATAVGLTAGLLLASGGGSTHLQTVVTQVSHDATDVQHAVRSVKTAVTRAVQPQRCGDDGDPTGDDRARSGTASCSSDDQGGDDSGRSDDQAGDDVRGGP